MASRANWRRPAKVVASIPLRVAYTEGMGWRVMHGRIVAAGPMDTRDEAQAWIDGK